MKNLSIPSPVLKSRIPALVKQRGWTKGHFYGMCRLAGRSEEVAKRALDGDVNFNVETLAIFQSIFETKTMNDVIEVTLS